MTSRVLLLVSAAGLLACGEPLGGSDDEVARTIVAAEDAVVPVGEHGPWSIRCLPADPKLSLESTLADGPVRGVIRLVFDVDAPNGVHRFTCGEVAGTVRYGVATCEVDTALLGDGAHVLEARVQDWCGSEDRLALPIVVDNTPPAVSLILEPHDAVLRPESDPVTGFAETGDLDVRTFWVEVDGERVETLEGPGRISFESGSFERGTFPRHFTVRAVAEDEAGNLGVSEAAIPVDRIVWRLSVGLRSGALGSRPIWLDGDMLFLYEQALRVSTSGELVAAIDAPAPQQYGIADPVVFPDGTLRVVTVTGFDSSTPRLLALDRELNLLWDAPVRNPWARAAPGPNGETIVNEEDGSIVVFEADGRLRWRRHVAVQDFCCAANSVIPGVLADGSIVTTWGGGLVHAVDATGALQWTHDLASGGPADFTPLEAGHMLVATTKTLGSHGQNVGYLTAIEPDGSVRWRRVLFDTAIGSYMIRDEAAGVLYLGARDPPGVLAFDLEGRELWRWETGQEGRTRIAVGPDGRVYATAQDYTVVAVDPEEGVVWRYDWRNVAWPDGTLPGISSAAPLVGEDGTVYVGTWYGHILALQP